MEGGLGLNKVFRGISVYILIVILIMFAVRMIGQSPETVKVMDVTELVNNLNNDKVKSIKILKK